MGMVSRAFSFSLACLPVHAESMIPIVRMISKIVFLILIVLFLLQRYDKLCNLPNTISQIYIFLLCFVIICSLLVSLLLPGVVFLLLLMIIIYIVIC